MVNLVGNAIKFTDRGRVDVAVGGEPDRAEFVLRVAVADTGVGVPADQLGRIFEPFRQADGTDARRHGGAGLGLAVVDHLVRAMGGRVDVASEVGVGSRFAFTVRLGAAAPPADESRAGGRPLAVLLAEDNPAVRAVAVEVLERAGHRVTAVEDGEAAVAAWRAVSPDVVLLDLQMPGTDGTAAVAAVRAAEAGTGRRTPVAAFTAGVVPAASGFDAVLAKPFAAAELLEAVERAAGQRSPERERRPSQTPVACAPGCDGTVLDPLPDILARLGGRPVRSERCG